MCVTAPHALRVFTTRKHTIGYLLSICKGSSAGLLSCLVAVVLVVVGASTADCESCWNGFCGCCGAVGLSPGLGAAVALRFDLPGIK